MQQSTLLNDYTSDYRTHLIKLKLFPFMYLLDITNVMFFITSLKFPTSSFNIHDYVHFSIGSTHQVSSNKLQHIIRKSDNHFCNFYFYRLPCIWNALPIINYELLHPTTIKYKKYRIIFIINLNIILYLEMHVLSPFYAHAVMVTNHRMYQIMITCNSNT